MKKRISPKVSSLFVLAGVMTTASVVSLATSSRTNNTAQLSTAQATTDSSTARIAPIESKIASVKVTNGYISKITDYNVTRTTNNVQTARTVLRDLLYRGMDFKYPGVNSNYSMDNYRYGYPTEGPDRGKKVDFQSRVMAEELILTSTQKWVRYSDATFAKQQMDKNEYLKHPAADYMYAKSISSSVKAVTKVFEVDTSKKGTISLGLFAAPGEVVTIKFDEETFKSMKEANYEGLQLIIGDNNFDEYGSNYNTKLTTLYPYTRTIFDINPNTKEFNIYSPFGGAISLKVNSKLFNRNLDYTKDGSWIKFEASGALECLEYVDGQTTKDDWDKQVQRVKEGKITAPVFTGVNAFGSVTIPFTSTNNIGGISLNNLIYPKEVFDKWNEFGFLSSFIAGKENDEENAITRLAYNFSTDSNWGGGVIARKDNNGIYGSPEVGANAFLIGLDGFSTEYSGDLIKAVSSTFAISNSLFKDSKDENAYKTIYAALAMILDTGRERNNNNQNDLTSSSFKNSYENVRQILTRTGDQRLTLYLGLMYIVGPKNFINYIHYSATNNPNTSSSWTPLKEIEKMSDFFKLDLYYTFTNSNLNWNAGWPSSYNTTSSSSDREIINKIRKNYKAVDLVGNMYASGIYNLNDEEEYTGDSNTIMQVLAGEDYVLDLNKFINSANRNFKWSQVSIEAYSKYGVKLNYNSKNKTLTYRSSYFYTPEVDEFDITIKPTKFAGIPNNYVSGYKWKIKIKQVTNTPLVLKYNKFSSSSSYSNYYLTSMLNNQATPYETTLPSFQNKEIYYNNGKKEGVRYKFVFVAPENGRYQFSNIWDDAILMKVNGKQVYTNIKKTSLYTNTTVANLNKGDSLEFDIATMMMNGNGNFGMKVQNLWKPSTSYNVWDYALVPNIKEVKKLDHNAARKSLTEYITNQKYVYKPRTVDQFALNNYAALLLNSTEYSYEVIDTSKYSLSADGNYGEDINKLNYQNNNFEVWNEKAGENQAELNFTVKFNTPITLASLVFSHRVDYHHNERPTDIEIIGKINGKEVVLYNDAYGAQFNDRSDDDRSGINLDKTYTNVSELKFKLINKNGTGIIFRKMYLSSSMYAPRSSWTYHDEIKNTK